MASDSFGFTSTSPSPNAHAFNEEESVLYDKADPLYAKAKDKPKKKKQSSKKEENVYALATPSSEDVAPVPLPGALYDNETPVNLYDNAYTKDAYEAVPPVYDNPNTGYLEEYPATLYDNAAELGIDITPSRSGAGYLQVLPG